MRRPRALDLFCGAGGASMGLHRAGFDVVGVDYRPQPRYPFEFHEGDALAADVAGFDLIWASPPCQAFTSMRRVTLARNAQLSFAPMGHRDLIPATRELLAGAGAAVTIIENVPGAPIRADVTLCGSMFDLRVRRHRVFEVEGAGDLAPPACRHDFQALGVYGERPDGRYLHRNRRTGEAVTRAPASLAEGAAAMGIDWMEWRELTQAIPPAYSEWIGRRALEAIRRATRGERAARCPTNRAGP